MGAFQVPELAFVSAVRTALLLLALAATGCVSTVLYVESFGRARGGYREQDLALILTQDVQTADLILTVKNTSPAPITNFFPETVFTGSVWVVQEGAAPLQTYSSNYYRVIMRATPTYPELVLPPGGTKTYHVPLETLGCPFSKRVPDFNRPVLAYGFMDDFKIPSNTIQLRHPERIQWESWSGLGPDFPRLIEKPKH